MRRLIRNLALVCLLAACAILYVVPTVAAVQFGVVNPPDFVIPLGNGTTIEAFLSHNTYCLLPWMSCPGYDGPPISNYAVFYVKKSDGDATASPILVWRVAPRYAFAREKRTNLPAPLVTAAATIAPFPTPAVTARPYP